VDMWALGIILYMMLTGHHPYVKSGDKEWTYAGRISAANLQPRVQLTGMANSLFQHLCSKTVSERY
jgi:serine/threonine protein kinase